MKNTILTRSQKQDFTKHFIEDGEDKTIFMTIRYDDACNNGHNTFAMTADIYTGKHTKEPKSDRLYERGGSCHEDITRHFPEFKHLIKWHLSDTDNVSSIENALYFARNREDMTKKIGEAVKFNTVLKFEDIPFTFKEQENTFWAYLNQIHHFSQVEVVEVKYDGGDDYSYSSNYSLSGFIQEDSQKKWYQAPFKELNEANEFLEALQNNKYSFIDIPYAFNEAVEPNLKSARSCAIWSDATLEQLQDRKQLEAREKTLKIVFRNDIESIGFTY